MNLFTRMCLMSGGHLATVEPVLAKMPAEAGVRRLSAMEAARFHGGTRGGAAWAMTSPNATRAVLDFAPDGAGCAVRVHRVDVPALHATLARLMDSLVQDGKTRHRLLSDVRSEVRGSEERTVEFLLEGDAAAPTVAVSLATTTAASAQFQAVLGMRATQPAAA